MRKWRWVRLEVALAIHDTQLAEHGGAPGLLDAGRLEAALARPRNVAAYGKPDAATLAAAYAYGGLRNHPFADDNKRTAWVLARLFLASNGCKLRLVAADAVQTIEAVAAGTLSERRLAAWFRGRISPAKK